MNFNGTIIVMMVALSTLIIGISSSVISNRDSDGRSIENQGFVPIGEKRPFCNAFTGCGKKRSLTVDGSRDASEPLTLLSHRIIQEARQWELLQQTLANKEIQQSDAPLLDYLSIKKRRSVDSQEYN